MYSEAWIHRCIWYDAMDPENVAKCTPGFRGRGGWGRPGCILVPTSPSAGRPESIDARSVLTQLLPSLFIPNPLPSRQGKSHKFMQNWPDNRQV